MTRRDRSAPSPPAEAERARWQLRVLESMTSGVSVADAVAPDLPLVYVNPAFLAMTGYRLDEVLGRNCRFLQDRDSAQPQLALVRAALREGREVTTVLRNYRKDGTPFWNRLSLAPVLDARGRITHVVGIQQDVTRELQAEAELRQAKEEAERAHRAESAFISLMSHELRTAMNAILGFAQLLDEDDSLGELQRQNAHEIILGGRHLLRVIDDLLELTTLGAGRMELQLEPVALAPLLDDCVAMTEPHARVRGVRLLAGRAGGLTPLADARRLKQVVLNLLSNAIKFSRPQGEVRLETSLLAGPPARVRIEVADTGPGIQPARLADLGRPVSPRRADELDLEGEADGIALAVCRRLVAAMDGRIEVASVVGEGSRFRVELPAAAPVAPDT